MPNKPWYDDYVKQVHGENVPVDVPRNEDGVIDPYVPTEVEQPAEGEDTYLAPLESMKKDELKAEAARRGVVIDDKATKDEIVQAIENPIKTDFAEDAE